MYNRYLLKSVQHFNGSVLCFVCADNVAPYKYLIAACLLLSTIQLKTICRTVFVLLRPIVFWFCFKHIMQFTDFSSVKQPSPQIAF